MKLSLWVEGEYGRIVTVQEPNEAWGILADLVGEFLGRLDEESGLDYEHSRWDMFHDDLRARSLKPWADFSLVESPSKRLWGVERTK